MRLPEESRRADWLPELSFTTRGAPIDSNPRSEAPPPGPPPQSSKVWLPAGNVLKEALPPGRGRGLGGRLRHWLAPWANPPPLRPPPYTSRADFQTPTTESGASRRRRVDRPYHRCRSKARAPFSVVPEMALADSRGMSGGRLQSWLEVADWRSARRRGALERPVAEGFHLLSIWTA